jgi:hypothetical protein
LPRIAQVDHANEPLPEVVLSQLVSWLSLKTKVLDGFPV